MSCGCIHLASDLWASRLVRLFGLDKGQCETDDEEEREEELLKIHSNRMKDSQGPI